MKSRLGQALSLAVGLVCLGVAVLPTAGGAHSPGAAPDSGSVKLGAYDPQDALGRETLSFDHHFVSWLDLDRVALRTADKMAAIRGRDLLITVEPFTRSPRRIFFDHILSGAYDREITAVCEEIGRFASPVLVRWGHEMDDRSGRYPWAQADSAGYIKAYRYFVDRCTRKAPQAQFVWSPMANRSPARYYPGDQYVDFVGLPIWGLQSFDQHYFGKARPFKAILADKYKLVRQYDKPVIVAEFGVSGSREYRRFILGGLKDAPEAFPLLHSVIYFNMKEPYHWPQPFGSPDWRVEPGAFTKSLDP